MAILENQVRHCSDTAAHRLIYKNMEAKEECVFVQLQWIDVCTWFVHVWLKPDDSPRQIFIPFVTSSRDEDARKADEKNALEEFLAELNLLLAPYKEAPEDINSYPRYMVRIDILNSPASLYSEEVEILEENLDILDTKVTEARDIMIAKIKQQLHAALGALEEELV